MKEIVAMHEAKTPNGETVTIYEIQEYLDAGTTDDPNKQKLGIKRVELADGRALTMVGRGQYKIDGTDEVFLLKD
jgi:hypothetical protein